MPEPQVLTDQWYRIANWSELQTPCQRIEHDPDWQQVENGTDPIAYETGQIDLDSLNRQ